MGAGSLAPLSLSLYDNCHYAGALKIHSLLYNCVLYVKLQASNPGQFDNESDAPWNKGPAQDSVYHVVRIRRPFSLLSVADLHILRFVVLCSSIEVCCCCSDNICNF